MTRNPLVDLWDREMRGIYIRGVRDFAIHSDDAAILFTLDALKSGAISLATAEEELAKHGLYLTRGKP